MNRHKVAAFGIILLATQVALADASYESSTQITGGSMTDAMKQLSFLSKSMRDAFAPMVTTTMVSGNRKVVVSKESTEITDLDKETITRVDNLKKTYTVMTFAQMRQMMKDMPAQMDKAKAQMAQAQPQSKQPQSDIKMTFDTSVKNTGVSKMVNGLMAQEQLITMNMHMTDPNAPANSAQATVTYTVTTDTWVAPDPPEIKEIQDFDVRMGKKLMEGVDMKAFAAEMQGNAGMAQIFAGKPGTAEAMAEMGKEIAKLKGTRVLEVTSMGGIVPAGAAQNGGGAPPPDNNGQAQQGDNSKLGMLGSAIGGSLNPFHKKKAAAPADQPAPASTASTSSDGTTTAVLMSTTTQKSNFSNATVPATAFQIPAGFKQIAYVNPMDRMNK